MRSGPRFVLDRTPLPRAQAPVLDAEQSRVVAHRHGPLLVLAGPGTGKTTTIVEAMAARLTDEHDPLPADAVLGLTFGRRAAGELRDRVAARLGGGVLPTVATFHAFAFGLLQQFAPVEEYRDPPRLLSGAEEDVRIRELLVGAITDGTLSWPEDLHGAIGTLGLANEIRAVLSRAKALGLEPEQLQRIGAASDRPAWQAIGVLARTERDVMLLEHVLDYQELLHRCTAWAHSREGQAVLADRFRAIYVDEVQDTDPLQMSLLRALVGPRTSIVAVGDPDQSIYAFRGADVGGLLRFPETFRQADGAPAPVVVLTTTRRFGPQIRSAATAVLSRRPWSSLPADVAAAHRHPTALGPDGVVRVQSFDSEAARAAHVAQQIRLAHLRAGVPWREMAVLVRSSLAIPLLQRALMQAGVPAAVAADEIPLRSEPAVRVLLDALAIALHPERASSVAVLDLLAGPLVGLDPAELRQLGRTLRAVERERHPDLAPQASDDLIRATVLTDAPLPTALPDDLLMRLRRARSLLARVHDEVAAGATPAQALWTLWNGALPEGRAHGWPQRLRNAALDGSRSAHHDLDAVMALFDAAERAESRNRGVVGVSAFLSALADQEIPAEAVAERSVSGDVVRLLTAHRAKGLEWDRVWVVGVEEGTWPDLRTRGSVLEPDRLDVAGVGAGVQPGELLAEERRLFFVALTRARDEVTVCTLDAAGDGGAQPSRFIEDLAVEVEHISGRPAFDASLTGLVARLRSTLADPAASAALRDAAARQLAALASATADDGAALVPLAHPQAWWGLRARTSRQEPVRDPERAVSLSGSRLEGLLACPLKWFLEHDVHADVQRGAATKFGSVVHAVADFVAKGEVPPDLEAMDDLVDRIWSEMRFEAAWQSAAERADARAALARFLDYHLRADRELVSTEAHVNAQIEVPLPGGGVAPVRLSGYLDRIERDADGGLVAIDFKNMRNGIPEKDVPEHAQLGVYQRILRANGETVSGAALVQLRLAESRGSDAPKVQMQSALPDEEPTWIDIELGAGAAILHAEGFTARRGPACRYCSYQRVCPSQAEGTGVVS